MGVSLFLRLGVVGVVSRLRVSLSVDGCRVVGVVLDRSPRVREKCVRYGSGRERCWVEYYLYTYVPRELAELGEGEVLLLVKVPRELVERWVRGSFGGT